MSKDGIKDVVNNIDDQLLRICDLNDWKYEAELVESKDRFIIFTQIFSNLIPVRDMSLHKYMLNSMDESIVVKVYNEEFTKLKSEFDLFVNRLGYKDMMFIDVLSRKEIKEPFVNHFIQRYDDNLDWTRPAINGYLLFKL